jgi:hypothetical protein
MTLRVGYEVSAGVSYAVDLVEGVRKVRYARRRHGTTVLEDYPTPRQKCAKSSNDVS